MQQENNNPSNNQEGINQNSNQNQSFDNQGSENQQTGTCPIFNSNRQSTSGNPYYTPFSNYNPQFDRQAFGNPTMNNPYISVPTSLSQDTQLQNNMPTTQPLPNDSSATADFIKGALIGAAVTYLLTNEKVQDALFKTAAKTSGMFQAGMEEVKERYEDAKAEAAAHNMHD